MKILEEFYPMLLLDIDEQDVVSLTFRTPSGQLMERIRARGQEDALRGLMARLGDDLDVRLAHLEEMKPTGSIGKH